MCLPKPDRPYFRPSHTLFPGTACYRLSGAVSVAVFQITASMQGILMSKQPVIYGYQPGNPYFRWAINSFAACFNLPAQAGLFLFILVNQHGSNEIHFTGLVEVQQRNSDDCASGASVASSDDILDHRSQQRDAPDCRYSSILGSG